MTGKELWGEERGGFHAIHDAGASPSAVEERYDGAMRWLDLPWFASASRRRRWLVGVSGGADSVALLHGLVGMGFRKLVVCHLNHGLRGRAAAADARFVRALAGKLDLDCEVGREPVAERAGAEECSLETAGRRARHAFFAACGRRWRCRELLLAHHADDQAETVLWNLLRGSRGASGMAARQELEMNGRRMWVSRPLLGVRRAELRAWLEAGGLRWREDASNLETFTARNRLRHEVLPLLSGVARRDAVMAMVKAAESAAELREIEAWAVGRAAAVDPQGRLHVPRLRELPEALRRACVFDYLRRNGVADLDRAAVGRVLGMLENGGPPKVTLAGGRLVLRRQGRVFVE